MHSPFRLLQKRVVAFFLMVLCLAACTSCSATPYVWAGDVPEARAQPAPERTDIQPADVISVTVLGQPTLSGQHVVGSDGTIAIPNVGAVAVGAKPVSQAETAVRDALAGILAKPQVSVVVVSRHIEVTVMGEVNQVGKYQLRPGDGVIAALALAGGLTEFGNENAIYLVRSSEPLRIRFRLSDLTRGGSSAQSFALRDGDVLVVQ